MKLTPRRALAQLFAIVFATTAFAGPYSPELKCHQALMAYGKAGMNVNGFVILPAERFGKQGVYVFSEDAAYFEALPEKITSKLSRLNQARQELANLRTKSDKALKLSGDRAFEAWEHADEAVHIRNLLDIHEKHPNEATKVTKESEAALRVKLAFRVTSRDRASAAARVAREEYEEFQGVIQDLDSEIKDLARYEYPGVNLELKLPGQKKLEVGYMILNGRINIGKASDDAETKVTLSNFAEAQDGSGKEKVPLKQDIISAIHAIHSTYVHDSQRNPIYRTSKYREELLAKLKVCKKVNNKSIREAAKTESAKFQTDAVTKPTGSGSSGKTPR